MKKSDTEQEQPGLEENKVPDSQSKRELDRELQELAEKEHQEEIYYEERRRERYGIVIWLLLLLLWQCWAVWDTFIESRQG